MSDLTPPEIARPDVDSARMVQHSIARLHGRESELTAGFYGHLFAMLPEVRALFPEDMAEQRVGLLRALLTSVDSLHDPAGMEARLQALGEIHYYRGIADDQYQYVAHALIRTVRDIVPGDWSTWLSSAWISVYSWMIQHMVLGAKQARAHAELGDAEVSFQVAHQRYVGLQAAQTGAIPVISAQAAQAAEAPGDRPAALHPGVYGGYPQPVRGYSPAEHPSQTYRGEGYDTQAHPAPYGNVYDQNVYDQNVYDQNVYDQADPNGYGNGQAYPAQAYPAQAYPAQAYPAQAYPAQAYPTQAYPAQAYPAQAYPAQEYPAQEYASSEYVGSAQPDEATGETAAHHGTWVRYPQLAELGQQPVATAGPVRPHTAQLPLIPAPAGGPAEQAPPADEEQLSLAGATPARGTRPSWFGRAAGAQTVATVFPRRRHGTGSI